MAKQVFLGILISISCGFMAGCVNDSLSDPQTEESEPVQTKQTNYFCDDMVKTLGPKDALEYCIEQAEAGDVCASATLGDIYASEVLGAADWGKANHWLLQAARLGRPEAQYQIAVSYEMGRGVEKNSTQSQAWMKKAALADYAPAQVKYGLIQTDPKQAYYWFQKSAQAGNAQGLYHLGTFYENGTGITKDLLQAEKLYLLAAQKNDPHAMLRLGDLYRLGQIGTASQSDNASYWYNRAIETQSSEAQYQISLLLFGNHWVLEQDPMALLQHAASQGHANAQLTLAQLYALGEKIPKNEALAFQWYLEAAELEHPQALYEVAMIFLQGGMGQPKDLEKGVFYLKQAQLHHYQPAVEVLNHLTAEGVPAPAESFQAIEELHKHAKLGSLDAQVKLAKLLASYGVPKYDKAAFHWASKAALTEQASALLLVADFHVNGIGTPVDYDKAFSIYLKLAEQQVPLAQFKVGKMYYEGKGVTRDLTAAKNFVLSAAKANIEEAKQLALLIYQNDVSGQEIEDNSEWLEFAADNGSSKALYLKAMNHLYGYQQPEQSIQQGLQWLQEAGEKNYALALCELGKIYMQGVFGEENLPKAHDYFLKAAKLGDEYSQFRLAHMYYYGIGVDRNYVHSYVWANVTAQKGNPEGILLRDELAGILNKDELSTAKVLMTKYTTPARQK